MNDSRSRLALSVESVPPGCVPAPAPRLCLLARSPKHWGRGCLALLVPKPYALPPSVTRHLPVLHPPRAVLRPPPASSLPSRLSSFNRLSAVLAKKTPWSLRLPARAPHASCLHPHAQLRPAPRLWFCLHRHLVLAVPSACDALPCTSAQVITDGASASAPGTTVPVRSGRVADPCRPRTVPPRVPAGQAQCHTCCGLMSAPFPHHKLHEDGDLP